MLSFKDKILSYIGEDSLSDTTNITDSEISEWLTDGITMLINMMPEDMLWQLSSTTSFIQRPLLVITAKYLSSVVYEDFNSK